MPQDDIAASHRTHLGASQIAGALGLSTFADNTPARIKARILGQLPPERKLVFDTGHALEPVIHNWFTLGKPGEFMRPPDDRTRAIKGVMVAHLDCLWIDGEARNVEYKTSTHRTGWGEPGTDAVLQDYLVQAHAQMYVHGLRITHFGVLFSGASNIAEYVVDYDRDLGEELARRAQEWWERYIVRDETPEPVCEADVRLLYPKDSGRVVEATTLQREQIDEIRMIDEAMAPLRKSRDALTDHLKASFGDASSVTFGGRTLATYKATKPRQVFDEERFRREQSDVWRQYQMEVPGGRRLLLKG